MLMAASIEDYGLIGDCETAPLGSKDGSIDWLCWPRFDSGACFAAHLSLPLGARLDRTLGQSLCTSQSDQRLSRLPPHHAPRHAGRRPPAMSGIRV
jgi:GH15 family glucan-1,4-alpha-glucosidase